MTAYSAPRYLPAGESALVVEFGDSIDQAIHDLVLALDAAVGQAKWDGVIETVPTYRSLMIHFDPRRLTTETLVHNLVRLDTLATPIRRPAKCWRIPACYDPPYGEDLGEVAARLGLPQQQIIDLHLGARYRVYMYGFAPGFTFLGGLPKELLIPRRPSPRDPAPPGSLLIAAGQALITGCAMPTGWYGVGRTPLKVFDQSRDPVFLIGIGDEVRFERIDPLAFEALGSAAASGDPVAQQIPLSEP
ncbi:allophanate hydrolase [Beijerinckiaceae bacterium]|nr:allophanate hydrolase [Beijerinckiaceae bacterium]